MCNEPTPIWRWLSRARLSAHLSEPQRMSLAAEVEECDAEPPVRIALDGYEWQPQPRRVPIGFPIKNCARLRMKGASDVIAPEVRLARSSAADCDCPTRVERAACQDGFEVGSRKRRWRSGAAVVCFVPGDTFRCQLNGMVRPFILSKHSTNLFVKLLPTFERKRTLSSPGLVEPIGREV